jgi:bile acid-coenzyme A ligase
MLGLASSGTTTGQTKVTFESVARRVRRPDPLFSHLNYHASSVQLIGCSLDHALACFALYDGLLHCKMSILAKPLQVHLQTVVDAHNVSNLVLVPSAMRVLHPQIAATRQAQAQRLSLLHGGDRCEDSLKLQWIELLGSKNVLEMYSMTEGFGATLIRGDAWLRHPGSVGRGLNCEIEIRGPGGDVLGANQSGEIFLRRLAATSASREFRSVGDVGCLDSDGYLYVTGRRSDLIIVGGENASISEIERCLHAHPNVSAAVVLPEPHTLLGHIPIAYVEGTDVAAGAIRTWCRSHLAPSSVPVRIHVSDRLPRTRTGKLVRSAKVLRQWAAPVMSGPDE